MAVWRVMFEAVPTVRSLRAVFSKAGIAPSESCLDVDARLVVTDASRTPVVRCRWRSAESCEEEMVEAKLPLCLVDHLAPVSVAVRADHLDVRLKLLAMESALLSVLEVEDSGGKEERIAPLRLEADLQALAALEEVVFQCKACSARLMKTPVTRVLELPSVNWQELSDDWYGGCCCEDKARSRSLVARCGGSLIPPAGTCLLGPAFCVVDAADVVGDCEFTGIAEFRERIAAWLEHEFRDVVEVIDGARNGDVEGVDPGCGEGDDGVSELDDLEPGESHTHRCRAANLWADLPETAAVRKSLSAAVRLQGAEQAGCGWLPFLCHSCSSLVGSVAALQQQGNSVHELHLFKCHISTEVATDSRGDVFRSHTPEKVLANEILSRTLGDATYRFLVRDVQYKTPLLQLMVLNHEVWTGSGEAVGSGSDASTGSGPCPTRLQPMMKVGFRETGSLSKDDLKAVEDWCRRLDVDDLYMWKEDASGVIKSLLQRKEMMPTSCQSFQQFSISFMAK